MDILVSWTFYVLQVIWDSNLDAQWSNKYTNVTRTSHPLMWFPFRGDMVANAIIWAWELSGSLIRGVAAAPSESRNAGNNHKNLESRMPVVKDSPSNSCSSPLFQPVALATRRYRIHTTHRHQWSLASHHTSTPSPKSIKDWRKSHPNTKAPNQNKIIQLRNIEPL